MDNYALEVLRCFGEMMLKVANKEFENGFVIVARTPEYVVLGDKEKNISFSRKSFKVKERFIFGNLNKVNRKGVIT
jgi:hypothetical protein